jgi:hypothetical protein
MICQLLLPIALFIPALGFNPDIKYFMSACNSTDCGTAYLGINSSKYLAQTSSYASHI